MLRKAIVVTAATLLATHIGMGALSDIPGEGSVTCPNGCPPLAVGNVTSSPAGLLSGSLTTGSSSLALGLAQSSVFLVFSGGTPGVFTNQLNDPQRVTGPLGVNPLFQPVDPQDTTRPIGGQQLNVTITNQGPTVLTDIAFYVLADPALFTGAFTPQGDGLSFGVYCSGVTRASDCDTTNVALLGPPSSTAGSINPTDLSSSPTFGDLLRFTNVNLSPNAAATFTFYLTDFKGTTQRETGGTDASQSLALAVVPTTAAIPEPGTWTMMLAGTVCLALYRRRSAHAN
jgi:hypothetical protein